MSTWKVVCPNCFRDDLWMIYPHGDGKATFTCFRCKYEAPWENPLSALEKIREWKQEGSPDSSRENEPGTPEVES